MISLFLKFEIYKRECNLTQPNPFFPEFQPETKPDTNPKPNLKRYQKLQPKTHKANIKIQNRMPETQNSQALVFKAFVCILKKKLYRKAFVEGKFSRIYNIAYNLENYLYAVHFRIMYVQIRVWFSMFSCD